MAIPYAHYKTCNTNIFFGKTSRIERPNDVTHYKRYIDIVSNCCYVRPMVHTDGLTKLADYFVDKNGEMITLHIFLKNLHSDASFFNLDTTDGLYLLAAPHSIAEDTKELAAAAYKAYATSFQEGNTTRDVIHSDRQVHWIWFRKTPSWRLTEEIVLRAASWIELNPGYTFHLWTNLRDIAELHDFLADINPELQTKYFESCIRVHFADDFERTLFDWLPHHVSTQTQITFRRIWDSCEKQDIVMKTDYGRNILLAVHGGIYTDFNDLVCLAPIETFLQVHAGSYVGVTDNTSSENISNYFMYASVGNKEWEDIVVRCTETLPEVYNVIHSCAALDAARKFMKDALENNPFDVLAIQTLLDASPLAYPNIHVKHFAFAVTMAVMYTLDPTDPLHPKCADFLRKNSHNRMKSTFLNEVGILLRVLRESVLQFLDTSHSRFDASWRLACTDLYLQPIMHRSNLPIFCRQQGIPLYNCPFGYLLRYACLLSYVGHIGDGSSYGMDPRNNVRIRALYGGT